MFQLDQILMHSGNNDCKIQRMSKVAMERKGELPTVVTASEAAMKATEEWADNEEAFEPTTKQTMLDEMDEDVSAEDLSLREAIELSNEREGPDTIAFAPNVSGETISLTLGQLREWWFPTMESI